MRKQYSEAPEFELVEIMYNDIIGADGISGNDNEDEFDWD